MSSVAEWKAVAVAVIVFAIVVIAVVEVVEWE